MFLCRVGPRGMMSATEYFMTYGTYPEGKEYDQFKSKSLELSINEKDPQVDIKKKLVR